MTPDEARSILTVVAAAHDRTTPAGLAEIWAATLDDIPYPLGRAAALEVLKTSPHLPKVADIREKARQITQKRDWANTTRKQLETRQEAPGPNARAFTSIYRHVNKRLREAGQNVQEADRYGFADARGKEHLLGKERCALIAEAACAEWLDQHPRR